MSSTDYGDRLEVDLAQTRSSQANGQADQRMKKRLESGSNKQGPTTRDASGRWVGWNDMAVFLGQPFDVTRIPDSKLEAMRRDPMLAFGMMFIKMPLVRAKWYIKCADPRRAAGIDGALRRIYGRLVLQYFNSLDYGRSPIVKRFELIQNPDWTYIDKDKPDATEQPVWDNGNVGFLGWKTFVPINPRKAFPNWTQDGDFNGFSWTQQGMQVPGTSVSSTNYQSNAPDVPLDYALWATNEKDTVFNSIYGYPRLGYAYPYWWDYWFKFRLAERAFERWADPSTVVYHPTTAGLDLEGEQVDYSQEALEVAEKSRSGANIALPSDVQRSIGVDERPINVKQWQIEQLKSEVNFQELRSEWDYLDVMKLRSIAIPEQALVEGKGGTSSRNVQAGNYDALLENQAVLAAEFAEQINRFVIPQINEANFGPGTPAELVITGFDSQDVDLIHTLVQVIGQANPTSLGVDMRELLDRSGIPLLSATRIQAELTAQAQAAQSTNPPLVTPQTGPGGQAGTAPAAAPSPAGGPPANLYYAPRERIELHDVGNPLMIEKVDECPGYPDAIAFYDAVGSTLYVRNDADPELVRDYIMQLSERRQAIAMLGPGEEEDEQSGGQS